MADLPRWQLKQPTTPKYDAPSAWTFKLIPPVVGPMAKDMVQQIEQQAGYGAKATPNELDHMGILNFARERVSGLTSLMDHAGHNDVGDATRHAEWAAKMTGAMGRTAAKVYGDIHERDAAGQPIGERLMDIINNHNGRVLRLKFPKMKAKDLAELAARHGLLQTSPVEIEP